MVASKPWYQSKTVWACVITGALAAYNAVAPGQHWPAVPEAVLALLAALGVYGRANASEKLSK